MRRSAALVALVALAATAGGGLAQGDGARDEPLARDVDPSAKVSALGGAPHESGWSNGEYWESGDDVPGAEDPNGSSSDVYDAVLALGAVPYRQCLVVVKNGALVHESYDERRGFDRDTPMESDSVGIIATVALVGAATQRGLFRLDQPVMSYGVRGMQDKFGAYAQLVTPRHLLAQTHGGGEVPPGQTFRRDDDPGFLATLFELIESTSGVSVREFARVALVEPLGLARGSIFGGVEDDENDDAQTFRSFDADGSAENSPTASSKDVALAYGRHVRLTCRDIAKLAQLFLNGGVWREETPPRKNRQIVSAQFAREAFSPRAHFPRLNKAFGLGVWVHDPVTNLSEEELSHGVECCAPVTGMRACGESARALLGPLLGDLSVGGPAERVGVFLGDEGSAVFVLPDTKTPSCRWAGPSLVARRALWGSSAPPPAPAPAEAWGALLPNGEGR
jgi:CubicO group peptidase (beta-lactamase class C family)